MRNRVFLFFSLLTSFQAFAGNSAIDSLKNVLQKQVMDTNRVNALNMLSDILWRQGNYDEAKTYAKEELKLLDSPTLIAADAKWRKHMLAAAYSNIGVIASRQGDYPEALRNYDLALTLRNELGKMNEVAASLMNIAIVYRIQGDYPKALEYNFKALKIVGEDKSNKNLSTIYGNIGNVYGSQGEYKNALNYYFRALDISKETGDKKGMSSSYGNIGLVYVNLHHPDTALRYYFKALGLAEEIHDKKSQALNHGNIGIALRMTGDYPQALAHCNFALKLNEEMKNKNGIASQLSNIGGIYLKQKKYREARDHLTRSLAIAREIGAKDWIRDNYQYLSVLDSCEGKARSSFENYRTYIAYRDSLTNEENTKKTVRTAMQYEFDKKEAEAKAEQDKKDAVAEAESRKQQIILFAVIACLVLVLAFAAFIYRSYLQKQKANREITRQKNIIEEKQREILDSIHYARRIQRAIMPSETSVNRNIDNLRK